jgi:acetylornithine deacetylase/succinyl-diaminopimelate desuccinylase-like protein
VTLRELVPALVLTLALAAFAQRSANPDQQLAHDVLKQLVEINTTTDEVGTERAAQAVAERMRAAGFSGDDVQVMGPDARHSNVLIRLRGRSAEKPILLIAHLDVVPARREDWTFDPFVFTEQEGYYYGRGVKDDKSGDATILACLLRWKRDGLVPARDILAVLTSDEETTGQNGIQWMINHVPAMKQADYALNADGGGGDLRGNKRAAYNLQASEKIYADYEFTIRDKGGHSSLPRNADNPIYRMAAALDRLGAYQFPVNLNDVTRTWFHRMHSVTSGPGADDLEAVATGKASKAALERLTAVPQYNALMRTTCTATMITGGHATNALPQMARVNVNCRILPNDAPADVLKTLERIFQPAGAELRVASAPKPSPASPLRPDVMRVIDELVGERFPGAIVLPEMSTGATDGLFLRNAGVPVYGALAIFQDPGDSRSHGRDERIPIAAYFDGVDFWHELVPKLAASR